MENKFIDEEPYFDPFLEEEDVEIDYSDLVLPEKIYKLMENDE